MNRTFLQPVPMYVMPNEQYFVDHFPPEEKNKEFDSSLPNNTFSKLFSPDKTSKSSKTTKVPMYSPGKPDQHFSAFDKKEDHSRHQPNQSKSRTGYNSSSLTKENGPTAGEISPQKTHKRHQSEMSDMTSLPSLGNKKIPNLNFAKANQKGGFQNPMLTPITFVSKDH